MIKTTIKKALDWARSDEMHTFLCASTCSLEKLFEGRADLFMVAPLDQVDAQAVFLRLLTNIILGMAVRLEGAKKLKKNALLVLDEFVRLGRMEKLINIAHVAAGCGIEALFITQDKGQIEGVYGDTVSVSITVNARCRTRSRRPVWPPLFRRGQPRRYNHLHR